MNDKMWIIRWDDKYLVGIKELDDQHKEIINVVNELVPQCLSGGNEVGVYLLKVIHASSGFAKKHFAAEERLMKSLDYPDLAEHRRQHMEFVRAILALAREFEEGRQSVSVDLACFLSAWIIGHIKTSDRKYAEYIRSKNISLPA